MDEQNQAKPAGCATIWFGAAILWLFIFAHVFDDVRHGNENLALGFGIPFWLIATLVSASLVRLLWACFPNLAPRRSNAGSGGLPVGVGLLIALGIGAIWCQSALFSSVYDSCKIIALIVAAGVMLGFVYKMGGRFNVLVSVLSGALAAIAAFLVLMAFSSGGNGDLLEDTLSMASIGVPYAVAVSLYDCCRRASTAKL